MKYASFLDEQLSVYPLDVRLKCINYHKWKLMIKGDPEFINRHWRKLIYKECKRTDNFLYPRYTCTTTPLPPAWLRHLSILNTDTFYKICKKIDKKIGPESNALKYYSECIKRKKYIFTSISLDTLL